MGGMRAVELESALLLRVPAAEAAVGVHRVRLDASSRDGVPAHVTVLYPFLPPAEIGPEVLAELSRLFAGAPRFSFSLDQVRWFGESVVWLGPSDASPFLGLIDLATPITTEATEVTLMAGSAHGQQSGPSGRWQTVASFPLG